MRFAPLLIAATFIACSPASKTDKDLDGIMADVDCNDYDQTIGEPEAYFIDNDGDSFGGEEAPSTCDPEENYVSKAGDCDDDNPNVNPGMAEICNDIDDNCDTWTDEGLDTIVLFADADDDGFGDADSPVDTCLTRKDGYTDNNQDCNDGDEAIFPGAIEVCDGADNDCDSITDEPEAVDAINWYVDRDGDTFGDMTTEYASCDKPGTEWVENGEDCNDLRNDINPNQDEICDNIDNNCDGLIDDSTSVDAVTYYADTDSDGFGDSDAALASCEMMEGYTINSDDCDDTDNTLNPNTPWYADTDSDSYGDPSNTTLSCTQPTGYLRNAKDCDDTDDTVNPDATEVCDDIDNNCDGLFDDSSAADAKTWHADLDGDGYGSPTISGVSCTAPTGFIADGTDCDDYDADEFPGQTWYLDADGDNYGDTTKSKVQCERPTGYGANPDDCDDTEPLINPGAQEYCDGGIDNDCDELIDADDPSSAGDATWYYDGDSDGHGDISVTKKQCSQPTNYEPLSDDCDDSVAIVNPSTAEICNDGYDNDCDGTANSCGWQGDYTSADADYAFLGTNMSAYLGTSVSGVGDIDDDGKDDFIVASYGADRTCRYSASSTYYYGCGRSYLVGSDQTLSTSQSIDKVHTASFGKASNSVGSGNYYFGRVVSGVGDFNGDGDNDILIGDNYHSSYRGQALLFLGPFDDDYDEADADFAWKGTTTYDQEASVVRNAGDYNDDGYDDIMIGSPFWSSYGRAYVIFGSATYSSSKTSFSDADLIIEGKASYENMGSGLSGVGDINGDDAPELAVGAYGASSYAGRVYIFDEGYSGTIDTADADTYLEGADSSDYCGYSSTGGHSVDTMGDINNDGYSDILVGCYYADGVSTSAGAAYIVYGASDFLDSSSAGFKVKYALKSDADITLRGEDSYDYAGTTSVYAGDANGDDISDLLVGAYSAEKNTSAYSTGEAYLLNGPIATGKYDLADDNNALFAGTRSYDYLGYSAAPIGDFNDDGLGDFIVTAYGHGGTYSYGGAAYMFLGQGW
jgi:hypothetical protein